jgi:hypothetical protein
MIGLTLFLAVSGASAQNQDKWLAGVYMGQAVGGALGAAIGAMQEASDLGFHSGISLFGTYVEQEEAALAPIGLEKGVDYLFLGACDEDASDVRIRVLDTDDAELAAEDEPGQVGALAFTPESDGDYVVEIGLPDAKSPAFCAIVVLAAGGVRVSQDALFATADAFSEYAEGVRKEVPDLAFHSGENEWGLLGAVASEGEMVGLAGLSYNGTTHRFGAAAGKGVTGVKVSLTDADGNVLEQAEQEGEAVVAFAYDTEEDGEYQLILEGATADPPGFLFISILEPKGN